MGITKMDLYQDRIIIPGFFAWILSFSESIVILILFGLGV